MFLQRTTAGGRQWQCVIRQKDNYCSAGVIETNGKYIGKGSHSHPANPGVAIAKKVTAKVSQLFMNLFFVWVKLC